MYCPRCLSSCGPGTPQCQACGFTAKDLEDLLGRGPARVDPVMDVAHCLRLTDRTALEAAVDDFEHRFPQVHLSLFLGAMPVGMTVAEAGMWLLNHGTTDRRGIRCDNDLGVILLIDPAARQVGLSIGYALEGFLHPSQLQRVLDGCSHHLVHAQVAAACLRIIGALDVLLRRAGTARLRTAPDGAGNWKKFFGLSGQKGARQAATRPLSPTPP
jgi:hypothetical protein